MTTHCDTVVAFGLAVVAHQSPTCPLPFHAPKREPLADIRAELALRQAEEEARRSEAGQSGWDEVDASEWQPTVIG